jgi:hypothetical protein
MIVRTFLATSVIADFLNLISTGLIPCAFR